MSIRAAARKAYEEAEAYAEKAREDEIKLHEARRARARTAAMDLVESSDMAKWFPEVQWKLRWANDDGTSAVVYCDEEPDLLFIAVRGGGTAVPTNLGVRQIGNADSYQNPTLSHWLRGAITVRDLPQLHRAFEALTPKAGA